MKTRSERKTEERKNIWNRRRRKKRKNFWVAHICISLNLIIFYSSILLLFLPPVRYSPQEEGGFESLPENETFSLVTWAKILMFRRELEGYGAVVLLRESGEEDLSCVLTAQLVRQIQGFPKKTPIFLNENNYWANPGIIMRQKIENVNF